MRDPATDQLIVEKASAGWVGGCNSTRSQWLMEDNQYRWGVNIVNRGGIVQTRYGNAVRLTGPPGSINLQGVKFVKILVAGIEKSNWLVTAIDGSVYAIKFNDDGTLTQPANWNTYKLSGIQFRPDAKAVYWCVAEQSDSSTTPGTLAIIPTKTILMMQDGFTAAAVWDGDTARHLDSATPNFETPIGTQMAFSGNRLWLAVNNSVLASDLGDPTKFTERVPNSESGQTGDYRFEGNVIALTNSVADNHRGVLLVFTQTSVNALQSNILDRSTWNDTGDFQTVILPSIGCVAPRSVVNHAGLIWWYSYGGLVSIDSAATSFLTSQIHYRDVEMSFSKRNFAPDLSGIASASFEAYLLVSVPSGDTLNAHTMALDYSIADEFQGEAAPPAWQGVWTGFRPVEWTKGNINGAERIFFGSVDYQSLSTGPDGTFLHIWEAFQPDRVDSYTITDQVQGKTVNTVVRNQIYCSFESKLLGDGMELKAFRYAQAHLIEMGDVVNLAISVAGTVGGYKRIFNKKFIANLNSMGITDPAVIALDKSLSGFRVQSRHITTQELAPDFSLLCDAVEQDETTNIDRAFSLYFQWCGRMGIDVFRMITQRDPEMPFGQCQDDETGWNIVTVDGKSFHGENA